MNTPTQNTPGNTPRQASEPVDPSRFEAKASLTMPDAKGAMAFAGITTNGHSITLDTGIESGGATSGPDPLGLLLLALGSCTGMDVISILRKKRQTVTSYSINVYATQAAEHPRIYTNILVEHIVAGQGVDPKAVARSLELSTGKYCPVHALLSRATHVEHVYRVIELIPGGEEWGVTNEVATRRFTFFVSCATFFAVGLFGGGFGPSLPDLATSTGTSLSGAGALYIAMFSGSFVSQLSTGSLIERFGRRMVLLAGLLLFSLGLVGILASPSLPLAMAAAVFAGLGNGVLIVGVNVLVSRLYSGRSVTVLNTLNIFYGIGAIAGPLVVSIGIQTVESRVLVFWAVIAVLLVQIPLTAWALRNDARPIPLATRKLAKAEEGTGASSLYSIPYLWVLGVLLLFYVGLELGIGAWNAAYLDKTTTLGPEVSALAASGYWLSLTVGRLLVTLFAKGLQPERLLLIGFIGATAGGILLSLVVGNAPLTIVAIMLLGLSFAPVFPTLVAIVTITFHNASDKAASIVLAMGSIGGLVLPWLQGVILEGLGPAANALYAAIGTAFVLALFLGTRLVAIPVSGAPKAQIEA